jgi:intracellular sulfur oxidation DsrE/DsrF family protein
MKTVFHVADGADDVQDAAIRYATGIFEDESVTMDAVAVVANASGIELVRSDSAFAEEIAELSEGAVQSRGLSSSSPARNRCRPLD